MLAQGRVQVSLAETYAEPLARRGWSPEKTWALASRVVSLDERYSARSSSADASRRATLTKHARVDAAKSFIETLLLAVFIVLRDFPDTGVSKKAFRRGQRLGRSSSRISKYLMKIRPFVVTLDEHLAPYFGGESPVALLESIKSALDASGAAQEIKQGLVPPTTAELRSLNGQILEMIEDVNRVAKIAFADQPAIAAQFNKDLLERAAQGSPKVDPPAEPQTELYEVESPRTDPQTEAA